MDIWVDVNEQKSLESLSHRIGMLLMAVKLAGWLDDRPTDGEFT